MTPSRLIRWTGLAAMLGAAVWWTSWILNGFTRDGAVAVLGLSERGWRTVANAALVSFIGGLAGIAAAHASRAGKDAFVGFLTTLFGLVAVFAGDGIAVCVAAASRRVFAPRRSPRPAYWPDSPRVSRFQGKRTARLGPARPARFRRDSGTNACRTNGSTGRGHP